jgi:hypothetical protein
MEPLPKHYFVYLIRSQHFVKIGSAYRPDLRLLELQCGNPRELWLEAQYDFGWRERARAVEFAVHSELAAQRVRGEWFLRRPINPHKWLEIYRTEHLKLLEEDSG